MDKLIRVNDSVINATRLLAVQYKPEKKSGSFQTSEHYLAVFDTGQEIKLSLEDGKALIGYYQSTVENSAGAMATTSESAT